MRTRWDTMPRRVKRPGMLAGGDGSTLSLDFTAMSSLDSRFTFTRSSTTSTFINSSGLVATAGTNVPRFDHDPTTLAPRGLLIEGSATNLINWSETFDISGGATNWNWSALNVTRGTVTTTNPTGTSATVIKIEETSATGVHAPLIVPSASSSTTYTASVFAKAAERSYVQLFDNGGSSASAMVNLSNGAVVSESTAGITTVTPLGTTGWYRISMRLTTGAAQTSINFQLRLSTNGTTTSYAGTTGSGIYIWGAQLEAGSGASSYIPTGASTVQRAADSCSLTGSNFSSWYGTPTAFTVVFEGTVVSAGLYTRILNFSSGANTLVGIPHFNIGVPVSASNRPFINSYIVSSNNVDTYVPLAGAVTNGVAFKLAARCQATLHRITRGTGLSGSSSYNGFPAGLANLYLGGTDGAYQLATWYSKLKFFPIAISDSQMDVLAT